jgi:uncharacterized iron-regulated membrane protein
MPLLDDQLLGSLLHEAGDSFDVPSSGAAAILERIQRDDGDGDRGNDADGDRGNGNGNGNGNGGVAPLRALRSPRAVIRAHRVLAVAAALILVALVAGGVVWSGTTTPKSATTAASKTRTAKTAKTAPVSAAHGATNGSTNSARSAATPAVPPTSTGFSSAAPSLSNPSNQTNSSTPALPTAVGQPARIEQTGSLDIEVARGALSATVTRLTTLATSYGGFVANSQTNAGASGDQGPSGTVTLQIPVANFSAVLKEVETLGKVSQLTTKATDVTAQYVDLQSRLTALEASRQQYLTIMTKANSVGDILAVQAQLDSLQQQIEQLQGQLNVLGSETDYSTLIEQLSEPGPHHPAPRHHRAAAPSGLSRAWHGSLHGFAAGVEGLIRVAGPALFALLCLAALVLGGQLFRRRLQRHNL